MTRQLTLTAAEWASVQPDGTLWLAWEGTTLLVPRSVLGHHQEQDSPPAVFVQACAPCETCHDEGVVFNGVDYHPCPDCRIELVGPCEIDGCRWSPHRTLGYAYAVGQPLPIVARYADEPWPDNEITYERDRGVLWGKQELTAALAHYGSPETLVGRWAIQLRVVGS